jgi:hypothetical protein
MRPLSSRSDGAQQPQVREKIFRVEKRNQLSEQMVRRIIVFSPGSASPQFQVRSTGMVGEQAPPKSKEHRALATPDA